MWSFDRALRRLPPVLAALALGVGLSGCIEPMYGPAGAAVSPELQAIEVLPIPDRLGHYLRNDLIFAFNGTGSDVSPRYRLKVTFGESVQTPIVDTVTGRATSATVIAYADYVLTTVPGDVVVAAGRSSAIAGYDRFSNRFSNVRAARDGEIRDAKTLADDISTRVAMALSARR